MSKYGSYDNALDYYRNLKEGDICKVQKDGTWYNGKVHKTECLGIKSIIVHTDNNLKIAVFPNNAAKIEHLEIDDTN